LRHYTNLGGMQKKIECLLRDFRFGTVWEVCEKLMEPQITRISQKAASPHT